MPARASAFINISYIRLLNINDVLAGLVKPAPGVFEISAEWSREGIGMVSIYYIRLLNVNDVLAGLGKLAPR